MIVKALRRTHLRNPSRWEGTLGDGRKIVIEYGSNALSVAVAAEKERKEQLPPEVGRRASYLVDQQLVALMRQHFPDIELL